MNHVNLADEDDLLIAISQSGTSRQVIQGLELGKEKGLKSIAITAFAQSRCRTLQIMYSFLPVRKSRSVSIKGMLI